MDVPKIAKTLATITFLPKLIGLLPIKYCKIKGEFVVIESRRYWFIYYINLSVAIVLKILALSSLIVDIFVHKYFSFRKQGNVLRAFYYLPISLYSLMNMTQTRRKIHEVPATLNTFLKFYQLFQGISIRIQTFISMNC